MSTTNGTVAVRVRSATWLADRVMGLDLVSLDGTPLPLWEAGAHIDLILPSGKIRQYSLHGSHEDRRVYQVAVLLEADGRGGSKEVHETALVGREIAIRGPRNHFALVDAADYRFVAGGIGITPILSMIRQVAGQGRRWSLMYGGRSRGSMAFLDELQKIPGGDVTVVPQDEAGLLDLAALHAGATPETAFYCCGPEGLLRALTATLEAVGRADSLHVERFSAPPAPAPAGTAGGHVNTEFTVELAASGISVTVPPDRSVLEVVSEVAPTVLSSCAEGYCGTCETRVISGIPDHRDTLLTPADKATNETMMICVSRCLGSKLVLDL
ncbi:PDR/VanB family oxidoreductase [Micromonospora olivasterospora]|uniref:Ferredoxin-NADP reductase n=1 Tax=Micromonospora olivasterospora TaxID=1880 RepID=A0A562IJR2_MICOL|nr:PDR/VanB family oxidoreductase [Micromonospora olivasterospora]TWH71092.1 ferredoxin-NADP reductase [Micromonospora olivasterospora]